MRLGIIGTGIVGETIGRVWAENGHEVVFGTRDPGADRITTLVEACGAAASAASMPECHTDADAVLFAVPGTKAVEIASGVGDLRGKVLLDANNPLGSDAWLVGDGERSLAEQISDATGARVVKAFNTIGMVHVGRLEFGGTRAAGFFCGDDEDAKAVAAGLVEEVGFEPVDCGPLRAARLLEPMAAMWVRLAYVEGQGPDIAFGLLRQEP